MVFYEKYATAADFPVRVPKVYACLKDKWAPNEFFCLAMENLNVTSIPCDSTEGLTVTEAEQLLVHIGQLHGHYWESDLLRDPEFANTATATETEAGSDVNTVSIKFPFFAAWIRNFVGDASVVNGQTRYDQTR